MKITVEAIEFAESCNNVSWPTAIMWIGIAIAGAFALWAFFKYVLGD